MITANITKIAPFPGLSSGHGIARNQFELDDARAKGDEASQADTKDVRETGAISAAESAVSKQHSRQRPQPGQDINAIKESTENRQVSGARALLQLINEMGGGENQTGRGQLLDVVI